jgi:hypothetical protein
VSGIAQSIFGLRSTTSPAMSELILEYKPLDDLLQGRCSECPYMLFYGKGNSIEQKMALRQMYEHYCKRVHIEQ